MALSINEWTKQYAGTSLDLSGYRIAFNDPFDTFSIAPSGTATRWYSGATYDFGASTFVDSVGEDGPFKVANGNLTIKMEKVNGQWQSGAIQSVNGWGAGYAQQYGYFEVRAKFPEGDGSWPSFFINSQNRYGNPSVPPDTVRVGFDIVEAYGSDPDGHHTAIHIRQDSSKTHLWRSLYTDLPGSMFDGQFHTYGGMVTPEWMIAYMDGKEIGRMRTGDEFKTPLYMILDLAMLPEEASKASGTYEMVVDYVRAYATGSSTGTPFSDVLYGTQSADKLYGYAGDDRLVGLDGNDTLDGGAGADTMIGGSGNDTYYVDNIGDRVIETSWNGSDTVMSSIDFKLDPDVNNITLLGSSNLNGTGNSSDNALIGNGGHNKLSGGGGNDRLDGGAGRDTLDGGAGADTMIGGSGNDTYYVDNIGDRVIETSWNGSDTVMSSIDFKLDPDVNNITLLGGGNANGTGNSSDNTLIGDWSNNKLSGGGGSDRLDGHSGNDQLDGGDGKDTLIGGAGRDAFVFSTARNASSNVDQITDFSIADDTVYLKSSVFSNVALGALTRDAFVVGTRALDAADRVIYDRNQGNLFYDTDGTGSASAVLFAQVTKGLALTYADFLITA